MKSDLRWVIKIPTPSCPKCGKEGVQTLGWLVNRDQVSCAFCGAPIDLTSEDWRAYIKEADDAVSKLSVAYGKIP